MARASLENPVFHLIDIQECTYAGDGPKTANMMICKARPRAIWRIGKGVNMDHKHMMETRALQKNAAEWLTRLELYPGKSALLAEMPGMVRDLVAHQVELEMQNQDLNDTCAELESNASELADLYDFAPVGCFSLTKGGFIQQLNFTAAKMLGGKRWEIVGKIITEFISPASRRSFERLLEKVFAGESPDPCEVVLIRENQPALIASLTATLSPKGATCHLAAVNFTFQSGMQTSVRAINDDIERIFNLSHDLLCIAGTDGRFHRVNPAFTRVLGHDKKVITESGFLHLVHPEDINKTREAMRRLGTGSDVLDFVNRYRCADGSYRWLEWRAVPYEDGMICALARDITDRKKTEDALRESKGRLSLFIRHAPAAIAMFDREMRYIAASDRWLRDYRLSGDLCGLSHYKICPEIPETWKEAHRRGLAGETLSSEEERFQRTDGTVQWLKWDVRPWFLSTGEAGGILIGSEDITGQCQAREALEEEVRRRTAQLEARTRQLRALTDELTHAEERERSRIAGLIHEDLQQMLVAALFNLDLLKSKCGNPAHVENITRINDILREAIKTARSLSAELSPPVLQQCGLSAALKWLGDQTYEKYGLSVSVETEDDLDPEAETGVILFRGVRELLLNITKHSGVKSAALRMWSEDDTRLKILVSDDGDGFDPEEVRAREGSAGSFGLFSIRERLESLGGGFEIDSAPGCGSRLTMWVPLKPTTAGSSADGDYDVSRLPALAK